MLDTLVDSLDDPEKGGQADYAFHLAIVRASGSSALMKIYEAISPLLMRRPRRAPARHLPRARHHLASRRGPFARCFLSLVQRDPDAAESRLREHFKIGDELRRKNLFTSYQSPSEQLMKIVVGSDHAASHEGRDAGLPARAGHEVLDSARTIPPGRFPRHRPSGGGRRHHLGPSLSAG
jgi:hypothetical protein